MEDNCKSYLNYFLYFFLGELRVFEVDYILRYEEDKNKW